MNNDQISTEPAADPGVATVMDPRFARVHRKAVETFGSQEKAELWLGRPTSVLSGRSPLAVLKDADGIEKVIDLLNRIDHGLAV